MQILTSEVCEAIIKAAPQTMSDLEQIEGLSPGVTEEIRYLILQHLTQVTLTHSIYPIQSYCQIYKSYRSMPQECTTASQASGMVASAVSPQIESHQISLAKPKGDMLTAAASRFVKKRKR